jgi:hypothetical protein
VRHVFGVDQFGFQVFQILVIQIEAAFQGALAIMTWGVATTDEKGEVEG